MKAYSKIEIKDDTPIGIIEWIENNPDELLTNVHFLKKIDDWYYWYSWGVLVSDYELTDHQKESMMIHKTWAKYDNGWEITFISSCDYLLKKGDRFLIVTR